VLRLKVDLVLGDYLTESAIMEKPGRALKRNKDADDGYIYSSSFITAGCNGYPRQG